MGKQILKVNGVFIQDPSSLEYQRYDLDSEEGSGRNQVGEMLRDRVAVKRKLVCKFPPMKSNEVAELLQAVSDVFMEVEFPDPYTNTRQTMICYVGDRTTPFYTWDYINDCWILEEVAFNFIER